MHRRKFIKSGLVAGSAATAAVAAPHVVSAQAKTFSWKMTNAYGPGAPFYVQGPGSPTDFIKMVDAMSQGRLKIQHFAAGELIPALEGFDAVSKGTVEMNCANAYFWAGKTFAAQYFTAVPFGFNFQGMNAWLYHGGGIKLWEEVYAPFNLVPIPMGNTGVQMTGWFKKPIEKVDDFKGLKMRIPGPRRPRLRPARRRREAAAGAARSSRRWSAASSMRPNSSAPIRIAAWACTRPPSTTTPPAGTRSSTVTELIINKAAWDVAAARSAGDRAEPRPAPARRSANPGATPPTPRRWRISSPTKASRHRRCPPTCWPSSKR